MRQFNVHLVYHSRFGFLLDTEEEMEERDEDEDEDEDDDEEEREREKSIVDGNGKRKRVKRFNDVVVLSSFPRYMTKGILSKETTVIHQ